VLPSNAAICEIEYGDTLVFDPPPIPGAGEAGVRTMIGGVPQGVMTGMNDVGDSFGMPFQDPRWFGKIVLQGLIAIIPIVGWIALAGWLMLTIDSYRAGRRELAPAGFHLSRGAAVFLVLLVYGIVAGIPGGILTSLGGTASSPGLTALGNLVDLVLWLGLAFLTPALILFTYREGLSGGFAFSRIWQAVSASAGKTAVAAVIVVVAEIIGGLGAVLCLVGLLFTVPYSVAITAGVVTWYERAVAGPAPAPPSTTASG
jgi:hypothetical protein